MLSTGAAANPDRYLVPMLLRGLKTFLLLASIHILFLSTPIWAESGPATPTTQIRGEVLMLTSDLIVVKSADGTSILIPLGKDTVVDSSLKVSDQAEVVVTSQNRVSSVKKPSQ